MPIVRTTCPTCDVVTVEAPDLRVRLGSDATASEAVFVCPACCTEVVHPVSERMVPVLLGAGCPLDVLHAGDTLADRVLPAAHPAFGPQLSELEIQQFVAALDRNDWYDELAY